MDRHLVSKRPADNLYVNVSQIPAAKHLAAQVNDGPGSSRQVEDIELSEIEASDSDSINEPASGDQACHISQILIPSIDIQTGQRFFSDKQGWSVGRIGDSLTCDDTGLVSASSHSYGTLMCLQNITPENNSFAVECVDVPEDGLYGLFVDVCPETIDTSDIKNLGNTWSIGLDSDCKLHIEGQEHACSKYKLKL